MPAIRYASLLFADIEESTRIAQLLTDSPSGTAYADFSVAYDTMLRDVCSANRGEVGGAWGDDFYAVFGEPRDALAAALSIQHAVASTAWPRGIDLRVRTGLHHGRLIESTRGFVGIELHRAMRICGLARGSEIIASQAFITAVSGASPPGYATFDLGLRNLKGFATPELVFLIAPPGSLSQDAGQRQPLGDWNWPLNPIIGRQSEIAALSELLHRRDVRLVSVLGPGGVGKTRLCEELALLEQGRFTDGVYMINLSAIESPSLVAGCTARALGMSAEIPYDDLQEIAEFLGDRSALLVFDNFEHVRGAAPFVRDLLSLSHNTKALVTSRIPLGVRGERRYELLPLPVRPEAVVAEPGAHGPAFELFIQRALEARPALTLTAADLPLVDDICTTLDGLPLALELAAAHVDRVSLAALARGLRAQPLRFLQDVEQDYPERQATMASAISWSYELIEDEEDRSLLDALAVFAGSFTHQQAADLLSQLGPPATEDGVALAIERLRRRSLLQSTREKEPRRYRLLRVIREFALARLTTAGLAEEARRAHLAVHARVAQRAEIALQGSAQHDAMDALSDDIEDIRAALTFALSRPELVAAGLRLAASLTVYWWHGHLNEGSRWLRSLLDHAEAADNPNLADPGRRAQGHVTVALLELYGGSLASANEHARRCLAIADGSPRTIAVQALATALAGMIEVAGGDQDRGLLFCARGVERLQALELPWMLAIALEWQGEAALRAGDDALAEAAWTRSVALFREVGDHWLLAAPLARLGELALDRGDLEHAGTLLEQSVELLRAVGPGAGSAQVLASLGRLARLQGRFRDASALAGESLRAASVSGSWIEVDLGLSLLASLCADSPDDPRTTDAVRLLAAAEQMRETAGPLTASDIHRSDAALAERLRIDLGREAFEAAWSEGRSTPTVDTVAQAVRLADDASR